MPTVQVLFQFAVVADVVDVADAGGDDSKQEVTIDDGNCGGDSGEYHDEGWKRCDDERRVNQNHKPQLHHMTHRHGLPHIHPP